VSAVKESGGESSAMKVGGTILATIAWLIQAAVCAAQFEPIDLSAHIQRPWGSFQPFADWTFPAGGLQTLNGVPFAIAGCIQLTGIEHAGKGHLRAIRKVFVAGQPFTQLHLLHYAEFSSSFGQPVALVVLHYDEGEPYSFPLRFGVHCMDWYHNPLSAPASGQTTKCVWMAAPPASKSRQVTGIWHTALPNPHPTKRVREIEIHSMFAKSTYTLIALTLEQGEQKPELKDEAPARRPFPPLALPASRTLQCVDQVTGQSLRAAKATVWLRDGDRLLPLGDYEANSDGKVTLLLPSWNYYDLEVIAGGTNHAPAKFSLADNYEKPTNEISVLKLKRGKIIGGVVRTSPGQGVSDAVVSITSVEGAPGSGFNLFRWPEVRTDAQGRWSIVAGNENSRGLEFRVSHPEFLRAEYEQGAAEDREPWIITAAELAKREAKIELASGVRLSGRGRVQTDAGRAITNARVACFVGQDALAQRHAKTDSSGQFTISNLETGTVAVIISAPGHAPALIRRTLEGSSADVKVELKPAMPLRVKVQSADGTAVRGAYFQLVEWEGLRPMYSMQQSDAEGMIVFDGAPVEGARYLISSPGTTSELMALRPGTSVHSATLRPITRTSTTRSGPGSRL
jgi:hypothetical protein